MKLGVTYKLFLTILLAAFLAVISSAMIMQWSLKLGFLRFINATEKNGTTRLAALLEDQYRADAGWEGLRRDPAKWRKLVVASLPAAGGPAEERAFHPAAADPDPPRPLPLDAGQQFPRSRPLPPYLAHQLDQRLFLKSADGATLIGLADAPPNTRVTPLYSGRQIVGYLGLRPQTSFPDRPHQRFMEEQKLAFAGVACVVVLLSAGLALLLATRLVRPLKKIAEATHGLARGTYSVRVPVSSDDELGRLSADFNALAVALEDNTRARRQWVADISHELRTPLTFLRSQVESILDGVREPSSAAMQALHNEIMRLKSLIDDLYQLSMSDVGAHTYRKEEVAVAGILEEAVQTFRPEFAAKRIALSCRLPEERLQLYADPQRLRQLFANLLDNSLKYTDAGGQLRIEVGRDAGNVIVEFQDSAPGVPAGELGKLFDRLYRVEFSRNRSLGGAGLGLAICQNIVAAHEGTIEALASSLGGVRIKVSLPWHRSG